MGDVGSCGAAGGGGVAGYGVEGFADALVDDGGEVSGSWVYCGVLLGFPEGVEDGDEGAAGYVGGDEAVVLFVDGAGEPEVLAAAGLSDEEVPVVAVAGDFGVGGARGLGEELFEFGVVGLCRLGRPMCAGWLRFCCGRSGGACGRDFRAPAFDGGSEAGEFGEEPRVVAFGPVGLSSLNVVAEGLEVGVDGVVLPALR
ncbi:hypothetical protein [Streptomyces sp. NPDC050355]|uniref:hypothetical protein n=1 Tax=Streptomyces sp. NPDC050355 TaxID=3365609 RepID=UPI00379FCF6B